MVVKITFAKIVLIIFLLCIVFFIGNIVGYKSGYDSIETKEIFTPNDLETALYFFNQIEKNFGVQTQFDKEYEVIGGIHWKDLSLPIIMENGVKTIRCYKYTHEP